MVANRFLGIMLMLMGLCLGLFAIGELLGVPSIYLLDHVLIFGGGPVFYFYVRTYLRNHYRFNPVQLLHFIPFLIQIALWVICYALKSQEEKLAYMTQVRWQNDFFSIQRELSIIAFTIFYFILIRKDIKSYHKLAKEEYSYVNKQTLTWFYAMIGLIMCTPPLISLNALFISLNEVIYMAVILTAFTFSIMLIILARPEIYKGIGVISPIKLSRRKARKSTFSDENKAILFDRLLAHMRNRKPFLDPKLTLRDLSDALDSNPNYVSQTINSMAQQSFFDFINSYRIEEARKLLSDDSYTQFTIEAVSKDSGFNSTSAFYAAFKKFCAMLPSEFINQNKKNSHEN